MTEKLSHHELSPEELAVYRATARRRRRQAAAELAHRRQRAWDLAYEAAELLRSEFGATRVVLFGSLVRPEMFTRWSDVDIAVWGLNSKDTLRALGAVLDLDVDIPVNLVDVNLAKPAVLASIEREGVEL